MQIELDRVSFEYTGDIQALKNVSLTINSGEFVAIVGANGSGKTTLARHLNGLLHPQSGKILVGDWDTAKHTSAQMAQRVAYVFQNPDEQIFHRTVRDEIAFGPRNLGYSPDQISVFTDESLHLLGLDQFTETNPLDLGLSVRKKVAIASALSMQSPILILDEPTAGFDSQEIEQLKNVLIGQRNKGNTVLIISHDMDFVSENVDRIILMRDGDIILDAPTRLFFAQTDVLEQSGIIPPQITRLGKALGQSSLPLTVDEFLADLER